jgi:hypothetical protein
MFGTELNGEAEYHRWGDLLAMFTGKVDLTRCACSKVAHLLPQTRIDKEATVNL